MKRVVVTPRGKVRLMELAKPGCNEIGIICQNHFSCISPGTETAGIIASRQSLLGIALKTERLWPKVWKVISEGRLSDVLMRRTASSPFPQIPDGLGYSSSGIVVEKGAELKDVSIGERVACAGSPHADVIYVPKNLFVKIPENVSLEEASFVALGAIAMQGVRRAKPEFGDIFVVIGLGIIGQITAQILKSIGCETIGIDIIDDRVKTAERLGCRLGLNSRKDNVLEEITEHTGGRGADGVIVCAGSKSSQPLIQALDICRDKGRVVLIGAVEPVDLPRHLLYRKEIDFLVARSYGPGRYDENYEKKGLDYPVAEIRWTEKRNMEEFLRLISERKLDIKSLITHVFSFEKVAAAYEAIIEKPDSTLGVLLRYQSTGPDISLQYQSDVTAKNDLLNVGVIGSGGFARNTHIPNLKSLDYFKLRYVAAGSRASALSAKKDFGFEYATTDYRELLRDDKIDMVLIATRHNLHSRIALEALEHGKHVFVEKPLGLTIEQCKLVLTKVREGKSALGIGFNRRFSPLSTKTKSLIRERNCPILINYRVVSGFTPASNWVFDPVEGGGRVLGEAVHFVDFLCWLLDSRPVRIFAEGDSLSHGKADLHDNMAVTLRFGDGSIASLVYGDLGNPEYPKERIEVFAGNRTVVIDDFKELIIEGANQPNIRMAREDKGHKRELEEFAKAILGNTPFPVTAEDGLWATFICHKIIESLNTGRPIEIVGDPC